jgi:hypothetical protein
MTASVGREVDANLLSGAAPGSAQTRSNAQDARGQDLGDLVEALGGGHQVGVKGLAHVRVGSVPVDYRADLANAGASAR